MPICKYEDKGRESGAGTGRRSMIYNYYPGCTLSTKAKELDIYAKKAAQVLGFELAELEDWQCCGGVYPLGSDEIATKLSSVRALEQAREKGQDLVTVCSACHHVIKRVNDDMKNVEDIRTRANNYMQLDEPYAGETTVLHYLEVLRDRVGFDKLKEKVVNPLTGKKIGAYYGCLLLRPGKIMAFDDPENPTIMEDFIRALGAEPVIYPYRNECCGGYISLKEKEMSENMCKKITDSAEGFGADMMITACPLCMYNLNKNKEKEMKEEVEGLDINLASADELKEAGISKTVAEKIVEYRDITGTITEFSELRRVKGIGEKSLEKIKKVLTLDEENIGQKNKININEATEEELLFFGFTKKELQNIEKWKNLKGDIFSNIDLIRIVGERRYEKLKNDIKY